MIFIIELRHMAKNSYTYSVAHPMVYVWPHLSYPQPSCRTPLNHDPASHGSEGFCASNPNETSCRGLMYIVKENMLNDNLHDGKERYSQY